MTDPDDPKQKTDYRPDRIKDLRDDPRFKGHGQRDYFEFADRLQLLLNKEIVIRVQRGPNDAPTTVDLKVAPLFRIDLGVRMEMGPILAIREQSPAAKMDVHIPNVEKKLEGDLIEAVTVKDAAGKKIEFKGKTLDPERLPLDLRLWSDQLVRDGFKGERKVTLHLRRHREGAGKQFEKKKVDLVWDSNWRFDRTAPYSLNAPMPIPELGLAYQIRATVAEVVDPESPLKVGDVVKNVRYDIAGDKKKNDEAAPDDIKVPFMRKDLEVGQWANYSFEVLQRPYRFTKLVFKVQRDKETQEVDIPIRVDPNWPLAERGWHLGRDTRRVKASDPVHAVWLGLVDTKNRMTEIFLNLRGMILGRIGLDNLGGPITIAAGAYRFAAMDFSEFVFFIGLISINLAVVNFLPIPILDGGHMVFLLYEKLRGRPASETVRVVATYVGLAMIGCLMIFVLYLDARRWIF
jgi:regulator of sigma E protease